ncbi:MAG: hypothetical protein ACXAC7_20580, partial [Candidatus Hodarchaeales archaeon]
GHVASKESFIEATTREVREETGSGIEIITNQENFYVEAVIQDHTRWKFSILNSQKIKIIEEPKPWIIYRAKINSDHLGVVVYRGRFLSQPKPSAEVPALIKLPPRLLTQCPKSLKYLQSIGAELLEQNQYIIHREAVLYPFGSAEIIKTGIVSFL